MLLSDITREILAEELNVKKIHLNKLQREIGHLNDLAKATKFVISDPVTVSFVASELAYQRKIDFEQRIEELKTENSILKEDLSKLRLSERSMQTEMAQLKGKFEKASEEATKQLNVNNGKLAARYALLYLKELDRSGIYKHDTSLLTDIEDIDSIAANGDKMLDGIHEFQDYRKTQEKSKYLLNKDAYGYDSDSDIVPTDMNVGHRPMRPIWPLLPTKEWIKYVLWYESRFVKIMVKRIEDSKKMEQAASLLTKRNESAKELKKQVDTLTDERAKLERKYEKLKTKYTKLKSSTASPATNGTTATGRYHKGSLSLVSSAISSDNDGSRHHNRIGSNFLGIGSDNGSDATVNSRRSQKSARTTRTHKSSRFDSASPSRATNHNQRHIAQQHSQNSLNGATTMIRSQSSQSAVSSHQSNTQNSNLYGLNNDLSNQSSIYNAPYTNGMSNNNHYNNNNNGYNYPKRAMSPSPYYTHTEQLTPSQEKLLEDQQKKYQKNNSNFGYPQSVTGHNNRSHNTNNNNSKRANNGNNMSSSMSVANMSQNRSNNGSTKGYSNRNSRNTTPQPQHQRQHQHRSQTPNQSTYSQQTRQQQQPRQQQQQQQSRRYQNQNQNPNQHHNKHRQQRQQQQQQQQQQRQRQQHGTQGQQMKQPEAQGYMSSIGSALGWVGRSIWTSETPTQ